MKVHFGVGCCTHLSIWTPESRNPLRNRVGGRMGAGALVAESVPPGACGLAGPPALARRQK